MNFSELCARIALEIIKNVIFITDIFTLPFYFLTQRPWIKRLQYKRLRAIQENPSDPYSAWVRTGEPPTLIVDDCQTIDELTRRCIDTYKDRKCMGYRILLEEQEVKLPDGKIMTKKRLSNEYVWLTYSQVGKRIDEIMRGLLIHGVKPGDRLIIFMETRIEWMLTAQALYRMGGCVATVYATLGDEAVKHVINEVASTHILTSSDLLPKLKKIHSQLPHLKFIIYLEDHIHAKEKTDHGFEETGKQLIRFEDLEKDGKNAPEDLTGKSPKPDDICLIMYTSGSTGVPKGVMAWHKNFIAACKSLYTVFPALNVTEDDSAVGYLPLAHNLEFTKQHLEMCMGMCIGYAHPLTLTNNSPGLMAGSLGDMNLVRPSALITVPLILDRIRNVMLDEAEKKGIFTRLLLEHLIEYKNYWSQYGYETPIINRLLCRKAINSLGGKIRAIFAGGAPLSPATQRFLRAVFNCTIMQGYGATETTAITSLMDMYDWTEGRVGAPLFGCKVRLIDWEEGGYRPTDKPRPRGEIVVGGPSIVAGYHELKEATAEAFRDENGIRWFYTGDIGEFYPDGTIKIIDRKKDLLKLAFGEYVSLGKVEAELKSCPLVENMCVYGDSFQNFVVALVIPNPNAIKILAGNIGLEEVSDIKSMYNNHRLVQSVLDTLIDYGKKAGLHKSEIPRRIKLCSEEWTPENGLLTAGLKIRRKPIKDFYINDIEKMYGKTDSVIDANNNNNIKA